MQAHVLARSIELTEGIELTACVSGTHSRAMAFSTQFGCQAYESREAFFRQDRFDVVVVACANDLHAEVTIQALEVGSAVLCEKPLALKVADSEAVLAASIANGKPVFMGFHLRFQPLTSEIRRLVLKGEIGEVRDIYLQRYSEQQESMVQAWRRDLNQAGAGVLCDVGVHLIDYITWVTGARVGSLTALSRPRRSTGIADEHVLLQLELDNGALVAIDASRSLPFGENALHIHGSTGSICTGPLRWTSEHHFRLVNSAGIEREIQKDVGDPYLAEIASVRDAVLGRETTGLATLSDGLIGVQVLEAAIRSLEEGERIDLDKEQPQITSFQ